MEKRDGDRYRGRREEEEMKKKKKRGEEKRKEEELVEVECGNKERQY